MLERLRALPKTTVVLFEDETLLREFPPLRATWAKRGAQAVVEITGSNARRTLFGALNPRTGTRLLLKRLRNRAEDFQAFLRHVRSRYRRWDIVMILDKASAHTAKATQTLAEELRITFEWLPTACPELNPKELLWRHGKDRISANRVYENVDEQADAFIDHLLGLSNQQTLQTAGVLSDNFWLST
ncbi:MAG TPA: IS630 family transposase [Chloroflexota bacterium]|nr:IS630 family transposase [Chloroflexota bacterium]